MALSGRLSLILRCYVSLSGSIQGKHVISDRVLSVVRRRPSGHNHSVATFVPTSILLSNLLFRTSNPNPAAA